MIYAIITEDIPNSLTLRKNARPEHLQRLEILQNQGRLILAGPFPTVDAEKTNESGFSGSLILAEFPSLDDAETWAKADPYVKHGVTAQTIVKPFKQVLPQ